MLKMSGSPRTTFSVSLDAEDTDAFLAMMQALGCSTPDALIRVALWNQAHQSEVPVSSRAFSLTGKSRRKVTTPTEALIELGLGELVDA